MNSTADRYLLFLLWVFHKSTGYFMLLLIFWRLNLVHIAIVQIIFSIHRISQFGSRKFIVCNKTTWFFSSKILKLSDMITISRIIFWLFWIVRKRIVRLLLIRRLSLWLKGILINRASNSAWRIIRMIWNLYVLLRRLLRRRSWIG